MFVKTDDTEIGVSLLDLGNANITPGSLIAY